MAAPAPLHFATSRPHLFLIAAFTLYKGFILLIAAGTLAFEDYDTSTARFVELSGNKTSGLANKLLRWDAIYFVHTAQNGYVYAQEWAFGMGFSSAVRYLVAAMRLVGVDASELATGIVLAHEAHLAAVLALYNLTLALISPPARAAPAPSEQATRRIRALVPALLHILSPAGVFLSAPYAESSFAALSFIGTLLFVLGGRNPSGSISRTCYVILAGVTFGTSATFRSNGILSGLLFLVEVVYSLHSGRKNGRLFAWKRLVDLAALCVGGLALAVGFAVPQVLAWMRYCSSDRASETPAVWCHNMPPSIYTYVQSKYWNVGFLRYWTPNQIPLFLMAAPMLSLLIYSGVSSIRNPASSLVCALPPTHSEKPKAAMAYDEDTALRSQRIVRTLAAAQTLLAVLAFTGYHVQIINRISSGYVVWYWWTAAQFGVLGAGGDKGRKLARIVVLGSVVYGSLQAALFASFMPPA